MAEARSKSRGRGHGRPCLLEKNGKGTVRNAGQMAWPTVPLAKKRQRHGRNREAKGAGDRAFCKKSVKGTVEIARQMAQTTVPFVKKRQRHGRNRRLWGVADRAFCKKWSKARSKSEAVERRRPCLLEKNVKGTVEIGDQWAPAS